ncbi:hypothetical protein A6U86_05385 [Rhizobium sp. AC27/96]|nr:hypothetical protein A6U86_05385 [Rhizobium sp. AC27/96]
MKLNKLLLGIAAVCAIASSTYAQTTSGAIEQLPIRTLTHVLGHDGGGLVGREPVTDFLKPGSTSPATGNVAAWGASGNLITDGGKPLPSGAIVGTTDIQTIPNKTLPAPVITNGASFNGSTSGTTILQPSATASGTLTLPAATDTLLGAATPAVVTNKSIDASQINSGTLNLARLGNAPPFSLLCNTTASSATPTYCNNLIAQETTNTPNQAASFSFQRISTYTGGTAGFENAALRAINLTSAGNANYEDGFLSILKNYATFSTGAQNTAGRFVAQGNSDGSIWSLANETVDFTGVADPSAPRIGIEQIVSGNGTDANKARVGLDVVASRPSAGGVYSGANMTLGTGIRVVGQVADVGHARVSRGLVFGAASSPTDFDAAIDTTNATFSFGGAAILMAQGQRISFTGTNDRTLDFTSGFLNYRVAGAPKVQISDAGGILAQASIVQPLATPASSTATCTQGTIQADASFVYVCVAANTWKRTALTSF